MRRVAATATSLFEQKTGASAAPALQFFLALNHKLIPEGKGGGFLSPRAFSCAYFLPLALFYLRLQTALTQHQGANSYDFCLLGTNNDDVSYVQWPRFTWAIMSVSFT